MTQASRRDEEFRQYALTAPVLRTLLTVCGPLALYQALQSIFKILDALMAAHISSSAVSAVSCLSQITLMITALGSGLAVGGSIKISEAYGQGDYELVSRRTATLYALATVVSLLVAVLLIPFAVPFLRLLNTPEELISAGAGYFRVEILCLVVNFFNTVYIAIERSRGRAKKILLINAAVIVLKLGLSALFVYGLNGDVVTIAAATLISQLALLGYALFSMARDEGAFCFAAGNIHMRGATVLPILNLSYPVAAEKLLFSAGKVLVNSMSGQYGELTVGALGVSNNIGGLTTGWHAGMLDGASALISQNRGAGKYRRTLQLYGCLLAVDVAIGALGLLLMNWGLPWLAQVFAQSKEQFDPVFQEMIVSIHRWEMLGYLTLGVNSATLALLLGYGYTKLTLALNVARVFLFRVPVLWALQTFTSLGPEAVGLTMMISNVCAGLSAAAVAVPVVRRILRREAESQAGSMPEGNSSYHSEE